MQIKVLALFSGLLALSSMAMAAPKPGLIIFTGTKAAQIEKAYAEGSTLVVRTANTEERIGYFPLFGGAQDAAEFINAGNSISVESCLALEYESEATRECTSIKVKTGVKTYTTYRVVGTDCGMGSFTPIVKTKTGFKLTSYVSEKMYVTRATSGCSGAEVN